MTKQVLINLAVKDLDKSMGFYTASGFVPEFSDETAKRMVWSETISLMIMTREKLASFATKPIADTKSNMAGYYSLLVSSIDELNNVLTNGLNAGGREPKEMSDYGFMQQRTIEGFDGHTWNFIFMDMPKTPTGQPSE
jgi:predicted lactoylglutathione lyase